MFLFPVESEIVKQKIDSATWWKSKPEFEIISSSHNVVGVGAVLVRELLESY